MTWVQENGTVGKVLSQNILDIYNYEGNNSFIENQVTTITSSPNEKIIDIVIDSNENILVFNSAQDISNGNDLLIIKKINNGVLEVVLSIPFSDTYYIWENLHFLPNTNEVLYFNTSSTFPILIDLNTYSYQSLNNTTNIEHCGSVIFGNNQQKYLINQNNSGTGPYSQTLYTFNGISKGTIFEEGIFDLYFIGCYASIGYDNMDNRFEYVLRSDGRSSVGQLDVESFGLVEENLIGDTTNLNHTENPLFFFTKN